MRGVSVLVQGLSISLAFSEDTILFGNHGGSSRTIIAEWKERKVCYFPVASKRDAEGTNVRPPTTQCDVVTSTIPGKRRRQERGGVPFLGAQGESESVIYALYVKVEFQGKLHRLTVRLGIAALYSKKNFKGAKEKAWEERKITFHISGNQNGVHPKHLLTVRAPQENLHWPKTAATIIHFVKRSSQFKIGDWGVA